MKPKYYVCTTEGMEWSRVVFIPGWFPVRAKSSTSMTGRLPSQSTSVKDSAFCLDTLVLSVLLPRLVYHPKPRTMDPTFPWWPTFAVVSSASATGVYNHIERGKRTYIQLYVLDLIDGSIPIISGFPQRSISMKNLSWGLGVAYFDYDPDRQFYSGPEVTYRR